MGGHPLHGTRRYLFGEKNTLPQSSGDSGAERDRTADPHVANVVLSQLSYCPKANPKISKYPSKVKAALFLIREIKTRIAAFLSC